MVGNRFILIILRLVVPAVVLEMPVQDALVLEQIEYVAVKAYLDQ
jgi:hypothetical protein